MFLPAPWAQKRCSKIIDHRDDGCRWVGGAILPNLTSPFHMVCPCPEGFWGRFLTVEPSLISASTLHSSGQCVDCYGQCSGFPGRSWCFGKRIKSTGASIGPSMSPVCLSPCPKFLCNPRFCLWNVQLVYHNFLSSLGPSVGEWINKCDVSCNGPSLLSKKEEQTTRRDKLIDIIQSKRNHAPKSYLIPFIASSRTGKTHV